jgi:hypothetical protein
MKRISLVLSLLLLAFTGRAEDPTEFEVGPWKFTRPAGWQWVQVTSPMRKAQLNVPGRDGGNPAEVTFFVFGGGAGGVQANVQRWLGQFSAKPDAARTETRQLSGTKVTFVSTEGTFQSGMPGGPTTPLADYGLRGAILDPGGAELVFVKMTGPSMLVKESEKQFDEMIAAAVAPKPAPSR